GFQNLSIRGFGSVKNLAPQREATEALSGILDVLQSLTEEVLRGLSLAHNSHGTLGVFCTRPASIVHAIDVQKSCPLGIQGFVLFGTIFRSHGLFNLSISVPRGEFFD